MSCARIGSATGSAFHTLQVPETQDPQLWHRCREEAVEERRTAQCAQPTEKPTQHSCGNTPHASIASQLATERPQERATACQAGRSGGSKQSLPSNLRSYVLTSSSWKHVWWQLTARATRSAA